MPPYVAPLLWIAGAVVLLVIAVVLLLLARGRRQKVSAPEPVGAASAASPASPSAEPVDATAPAAGHEDQPDPLTDPVDLRPLTGHGSSAGPDGDGTGAAKDRLLAALLPDPDLAVRAVAAMPGDAGTATTNGGRPSPGSVAALLRAGMTPGQVAGLCGVRESALADLVARHLGLLEVERRDATNRTDEPGRAWASAGSAAGSTTPTTG